jgi:hypothetical protein
MGCRTEYHPRDTHLAVVSGVVRILLFYSIEYERLLSILLFYSIEYERLLSVLLFYSIEHEQYRNLFLCKSLA